MIPVIVTCLITCLSIIVVSILKPSIKIKKFTLNFYWVIALTGALVILTGGLLSFTEFFNGLTKSDGINPIQILILFLSMTIISIFLDELGFFDHVASWVIHHTKAKQSVLFLNFYLLVSILTMFTSNDIIILTLTPFIIFFCKSAKISPIPYLVSEFSATNTWSMMFIIGNPTNIYLASSFGVDFVSYFKVMWLPTLISGIVEFAILALLFRKTLAKTLEHNEEPLPTEDKMLTIIGLIVLLVCTIFLVISSYVSLPMYLIAAISLITLIVVVLIICLFRKRAPKELVRSLLRAPYELIPFVISMFAIVLALNKYGVTSKICELFGNSYTVFKYGYASLISANLLNNIPMSVIYSSIMSSLDGVALKGALFSSIAGSNIGAFLTPIGALAGIMWMGILKEHQVKYSFLDFVKYGLLVGVPTITITLITLFIIL